eukprot:SAG22_NODE_769_length_7337_cov_15.897624_3_plen_142_part_00
MLGRSDAGLLAVVEHGEEEYSRPGSRWEQRRPPEYWEEKPRAVVVAAEVQELCCTRQYICSIRRALAGTATGKQMFLAALVDRWVDEFEKQALVGQPDGSFCWPAVRHDDDSGVAGLERFAAAPVSETVRPAAAPKDCRCY